MSLFPTVLHEFEVPTFKQVQQDLIKQVYKERKKDPVGREMTNVGGWQSQEWGGWHSQGKDFDRNILSEFIVKEVSNYFTQNKILMRNMSIQPVIFLVFVICRFPQILVQ